MLHYLMNSFFSISFGKGVSVICSNVATGKRKISPEAKKFLSENKIVWRWEFHNARSVFMRSKKNKSTFYRVVPISFKKVDDALLFANKFKGIILE